MPFCQVAACERRATWRSGTGFYYCEIHALRNGKAWAIRNKYHKLDVDPDAGGGP